MSASSSRLVTPSRDGGSTPGVLAAPDTTDIYRPLATAVSKPLGALTPSDTSLPSVLALDGATYNARLSGKTVMLTDIPGTSSSASSLVSGRKRNRGDETQRAAVRAEQRAREGKGRRRHAAATSPESKIDAPFALTPSYASIVPVHYLHVRYMAQLCGLPVVGTPPTTSKGPTLLPGVSPEALQSKLVKADLTGAKLVVRAARNPSLVGITGIVVEETAGSIRLVGPDSVTRVVPKVGTQFTHRFPAYAPPSWEDTDMGSHIQTTPQVEIDILGTAFAYRSGERAGRKFRPAQGGGGGSGWGEEYVQAEWTDVLKNAHVNEDRRAVLSKRRKRGKSRRKDPLVGGSLQVF